MLRTTTTVWAGLFLLAGLPLAGARALAQDSTAAAPAPAAADSLDTALAGSFHYTGNVEGAFTDGTFVAAVAPGGYSISATEKRTTGDVSWTGSGSIVGKSLIVVRPEGSVGLVGALSGTGAAPTTLQYIAVFSDQTDHAPVTVYRKTAAGTSTQIGTATLEQHVTIWDKPGDLLAFAEQIVDKAMSKEIDLKTSFGIGNYTSLGIGVGVQVLSGTDYSDYMKQSDLAYRLAGKGEPVWIRAIVQGGPTVSWGSSIPLGDVSLSAGFSAGAVLRYTCDEQEAKPAGITDTKGIEQVFENVPANAFALPSNSEKALAMTVGARRTLVGTGSLALSGGAAFGYRLDDLGALAGKVQVGVDAGVSVSWGLTGNLELDFERQSDSLVHLHWTRGGASTTSAGVNFLLGLYVDPTYQATLATGLLTSPVNAVVNTGQSYTCVSFSASASWLDASQLAFDMTFDLSDPAACAAYNAAVLGDLRAVQALAAATTHAGLKVFTQTSTLTDQLSYSAHFSAFQVVSIDAASQTTHVQIDVQTLDGTKSATEVYSYAKTVKGFFAHLFGDGDRSMSTSASDATVVTPTGTTTSGEQLSFTFDQTLSHVSHERVDEELAMAGSLFGEDTIASDVEAIHAEQAKKGFDKAKVHFEATFGSTAISKVLAGNDDTFYIAYGAASTPGDTTYSWTADRIAYLSKLSLVQEKNATQQQEADREEAWDLYDAKNLGKLLDKARSASKNSDAQVQEFRDLAKKAGFDLRTLVALCDLAGRDDSRVAFTFSGDGGLSFSKTAGQATALPSVTTPVPAAPTPAPSAAAVAAAGAH